jgi:hypothetical protein
MTQLLIGHDDRDAAGPCALCGTATTAAAGLRLQAAESGGLVCVACGRRHAPQLTALLDVARLAAQVGRINHHNRSWPVMDALLKLARASEAFYLSLVGRERAA